MHFVCSAGRRDHPAGPRVRQALVPDKYSKSYIVITGDNPSLHINKRDICTYVYSNNNITFSFIYRCTSRPAPTARVAMSAVASSGIDSVDTTIMVTAPSLVQRNVALKLN